MDDLIKSVAERAGISPAQAEKVIATVMEQLDGRLPEPIAAQVRGLLGGNSGGGASAGGDAGDAVKDAAKKLGGLFGR